MKLIQQLVIWGYPRCDIDEEFGFYNDDINERVEFSQNGLIDISVKFNNLLEIIDTDILKINSNVRTINKLKKEWLFQQEYINQTLKLIDKVIENSKKDK